MILLSNLILFNGMFKVFSEQNNYIQFISHLKQKPYKTTYNLVNCRYQNSSLFVISNANNLINESVYDVLKIKGYNDFVSRNFWQKFINKYWQETIFISASSHLSEKYINKLKSNGLSVYKGNDYKNFLLKFSKDLLAGKILVSNQNINNGKASLFLDQNSTYVKYKWSKFLNFDGLNFKINKLILRDNISLNNKLIKYETIPVFTLINDNSQILMSESSNKLFKNKNFTSLISRCFNNFSLKTKNEFKSYTGLLFVNPEDSLEYKDYIKYNYKGSTRINHIQSVTSNMNLYYQLLNSSASNSEFRLIPDLKEVSNLIYKYQKYNHVSFDSNQKYGSNYFQGQPIYLIKPIFVKNNNTNYKELLDYSYYFYKNNSRIKYQVVFLNYTTAMKAWNKFRQEYSYYKIPSKPELYISNLELFINKPYDKNKINQTMFVPSLQTYNFIKNSTSLKIKTYSSIKKLILNKSLHVKTLISRLLWSLTSRQPINW